MNQINANSKSLYVSNLHHGVTEKMLSEKFSVAGTINSIRLVRDATTQQSRGFAYINFTSNAEAKHALDTMNDDPIKGRQISIKWNMHDPSVQELSNANLFIKNLDKSITTVDLYKMFSRFGNILSHKIASDENGSKGHGFVQFQKEGDAELAIKKMNGQVVQGKKLYVGKFMKKSERYSRSSETNDTSYHYRGRVEETRPVTSGNAQKSKFVEKSPTIHDSKLSYLTSMLCGKHKAICNKKINKLFDLQGAKGRLASVDGKVLLVTTTENSQIKCCKILEDMIHCTFIEIPKGSFSKSCKLDTIELIKAKKLKYLGVSMIEDGIFFASFNQDDVDNAYVIAKEHITGILYTQIFDCKSDVAKFILKHCDTTFKPCIVEKSPTGVRVAGDVKEVKSVLQQLRKKPFKADEVVFRGVALSQYFHGDWKSALKTLENSFRCTVSAEKKAMHQAVNQPSNIEFEVCQGDIVDQATDAIINGVSKQFDLTWGHVSPALLAKAGKELQNECSTCPLIKMPYVRATRGFNLQCKYVLHMVVPSSAEKLPERIGEALKQAKILGATSVSLPTLGAGGVGIDPLDVAMSMSNTFKKFVEDNPNTTMKIKVVVFNSPLLGLFQTHSLPSPGDGFITSLQTIKQLGDDLEEWVVHVTSDVKRDVTRAIDGLNTLKSQILIDDDIIVDKTVSKLEENELKEIEKLCHQMEASCKIDNTNAPHISVFGLKKNTKKLKRKIEQILKELENAMVVAKVCVWEWDLSGQFRPFPLRVSYDMTTHYEKSPTKKCYVQVCGKAVLMDFVNMTFHSGTKSGNIKKEEKQSDIHTVPDYWAPMSGNTKSNHNVPSGTEEYNRVFKRFTGKGGTHFTEVKITRIQHTALYREYQTKKKDVEKHMVMDGPVERELFHGTSRDGAEKICAHGFDRGFAGKNATAYGRGTYFAVDSDLSFNYTESDATGFKTIFLALVLTGNYCEGHSHYIAPPPMSSGQVDRLYDSVVNNVSSPRLFVVFKDASVYPQYLISFK